MQHLLVLPRREEHTDKKRPVSGPSEDDFRQVFGPLVPAATYVQTPLGRIAYYRLGPKEGMGACDEHILLLHGIQTPAVGLVPLAMAVQSLWTPPCDKRNIDLTLVDLWGHGLSDTPFVPHEATIFYALVDAVVQELGWRQLHLIGYSLGGVIAAGYVAKRPQLIRSLAVIAPAGYLSSADFTEKERANFESADEMRAQRAIWEYLEGAPLELPPEWQERFDLEKVDAQALKYWQVQNHRGYLASITSIFRNAGIFDNEDVFRRATQSEVPIIAIIGALDGITRREDVVSSGFEETVEIADGRHNLVREQPTKVAGAIVPFILSHTSHT